MSDINNVKQVYINEINVTDCHSPNDSPCNACKYNCTMGDSSLEVPMFFYDPLDEYISKRISKMELANIRRIQHMSKVDLSRLTGLSTTCISDIESADSGNPTFRSISKYLNALGYEMVFQKRKI